MLLKFIKAQTVLTFKTIDIPFSLKKMGLYSFIFVWLLILYTLPRVHNLSQAVFFLTHPIEITLIILGFAEYIKIKNIEVIDSYNISVFPVSHNKKYSLLFLSEFFSFKITYLMYTFLVSLSCNKLSYFVCSLLVYFIFTATVTIINFLSGRVSLIAFLYRTLTVGVPNLSIFNILFNFISYSNLPSLRALDKESIIFYLGISAFLLFIGAFYIYKKTVVLIPVIRKDIIERYMRSWKGF